MPGNHLNDTERRLAKIWHQEHEYPLLAGISIRGEPGLRGIKDLDIDFQYPLTVICGKNGCGKTTLLALSALAFHPPRGHYCRQAKRGKDRAYYTFGDFFFKGHGDPNISGLEIEWRFKGSGPERKRIRKQSAKWMRYDSRPVRPVHYLGASRIIPAVEMSVLKYHFKGGAKLAPSKAGIDHLNDEFRQRLSRVLGRRYNAAEQMKSGQYAIRRCTFGSTYTSFNMGAGEDTLIDLFYTLQETLAESLVVIEEIELGLHPQAQIRLAQELMDIALTKRLQIVTSSHSQPFIDSVPRLARVLLEYTGNGHQVIYSPTTRFAVGQITGQSYPELKVYCEDEFAASLIERILPGRILQRIQVIPVGGWTQVIAQYKAHRRGQFEERCFVVLDGDRTDAEVCQKLRDIQGCDPDTECEDKCWGKLPGNTCPEFWVSSLLLENKEYLERLAELISYEEEIDYVRDLLTRARTEADPKKISYMIARELGKDPDIICQRLILAIKNDASCSQLVEQIKLALDN